MDELFRLIRHFPNGFEYRGAVFSSQERFPPGCREHTLCEEDEDGLRRYGHSRDHRPDLPQIVIGPAVTKEGIPGKCWVMPGNKSDMKTVETVENDLLGWKLSRWVWVGDRGMNSAENRLVLQKAGGSTSSGRSCGTIRLRININRRYEANLSLTPAAARYRAAASPATQPVEKAAWRL